MFFETLKSKLDHYVRESAGNYVSAEQALSKELEGLQIYEAPLLGAAAADDPVFDQFRKPEAVGPHHEIPAFWLPGARSVLSFFLPFTMEVKGANVKDAKEPAAEWLHGRIEGQQFLMEVSLYVKAWLEEAGYRAVVPMTEREFWAIEPATERNGTTYAYTSNWSERHIGFACGLGTFCLSKGLITKSGVAGRFGSVVTDLEVPPSPRDYQDLYGYCTRCGRCALRCPVQAISLESGKDHVRCSKFLDYTKKAYAPRYGCGKCQTGVPCQDGIPVK